jgi:S1-C subfamily serine protease
MIDRIRPSVVKITSFYGMPQVGRGPETGTGFIVSSDGIVVTAKHVISHHSDAPCDTSPLKPLQPPSFGANAPTPVQATMILVGLPESPQHVGPVASSGNFRGIRARVLACDDAHDIAVLEPQENPLTGKGLRPLIESKEHPIPGPPERRSSATLSSREFRDGDPVFTSGYPLSNFTLITTSGYIASSAPIEVNEQTGKFDDVYWADLHVNPGNSGGPAFSLETGAVLGIVLAYQGAPVFLDDGSQACFPSQAPDQRAKCLESNSGIARIIPVEFIKRLLRANKVTFVER